MSRETSDASADPTPPSKAMQEAYINLSDYVYGGTPTATFGQKFQNEIGYRPLKIGGDYVSMLNSQDGFYAQAFISNGPITKSSKIIIAYEGTNLLAQSNAFTGGQLVDDAQIAAGDNALSYPDAVKFANQVISDASKLGQHGIGKANISVTGHSLGGAEAEYAAKKTGLGGATYAAPGIKGASTPTSNLTDYVDIGDPIGNYANDDKYVLSAGWGNNVTLSKKINHYGFVKQNPDAGSSNNAAAALYLAGAGYEQSTDAAGRSEYIAFGALSTLQPDTVTFTPPNPPGGQPTTVYGLGNFHSLTQYAKDFNLTLYKPDATEAPDTSFFPTLSGGATAPGQIMVCFGGGTRIRIALGDTAADVAVEHLMVGDVVVTASGAHRPIRWIGHRKIDCCRHRLPLQVLPVRIAAHAFGPNLPARDLVVSPGHALCVDVGGEVLIPASALVNGSTIEQIAVDEITYWHVELDAHDILLAENMPAESYLEMGNRAFFANAGAVALHAIPDAPVATHADFCRPFVANGPRLEAVRAILRERQARAGTLREVVAAA